MNQLSVASLYPPEDDDHNADELATAMLMEKWSNIPLEDCKFDHVDDESGTVRQ